MPYDTYCIRKKKMSKKQQGATTVAMEDDNNLLLSRSIFPEELPFAVNILILFTKTLSIIVVVNLLPG